MDPRIYSLIHVFTILLLTGSVFYIAANPQKHKKKKMMMLTSILSLLALIAGFGLMAKYQYSYTSGWVIVKLVAWLLVTGLAGMAYRKSKTVVMSALIASVAIALYMVYFKPF